MPITTSNKEERLEKLMIQTGITLKQYTTEEILEMDEKYQMLKMEREIAILDRNSESLKDISKEMAAIHKQAITKRDAYNKKAKMKYEEEKVKLGKYLPEITTEYATFGTLARVNEWLLKPENEGKEVLLFIDELNRASHEVFQELMNLVLNKEINGFKLDERVKVAAAVNPSSSWAEFKDCDYQVTEPDEAQKDRMTWLFVGVDEAGWINWATDFNEETGRSNIHEDVVEFISTYPDMLHIPAYKSQDDINPSPRSWERVSKAYTTYLENKSEFKSESVLQALIFGDIGRTVGLAFIKFLNEKDNPMLKPAEIFEGKKKLSDEVKERYQNEAPTRKIAIMKNCMKYLTSKKRLSAEPSIFVELINLTEADIRVSLMQDILANYKNLHRKLVEFDEYLDAFHDLDQLISL